MRLLVVVGCVLLEATIKTRATDQLKNEMQTLSNSLLERENGPTDIKISEWYNVWGVVLHSRLDELFSALEERLSYDVEGEEMFHSPRVEDSETTAFTIAIVGDSTLRLQADTLAWLLATRSTRDGKQQCLCTHWPVTCSCSYRDPEAEGVMLRINYYKVWDECVDISVEADFVYFGCGYHVLQLHPSRPVTDMKVDGVKNLHKDWEGDVSPHDICTQGYFGERPTVELNIRAEAVMARLGVTMVPSYDITWGQGWATPQRDGRHYPALVPEQVSHFLAKVNLALSREKLLNTAPRS